MSHICYEGDCGSRRKPRTFSAIRALHQHQKRCHEDTPEEETFLGSSRKLKRRRDEEAEEERRRQNFEAQLALEAANHEPEQRPVRGRDCTHNKCVGFMMPRSRYSTAPSIPDSNVHRGLGGFPYVFATRCRHRWCQSPAPQRRVGKVNKNPLLVQSQTVMKTAPDPQIAGAPSQPKIPSECSGNTSLPSPPTIHALWTPFPTFNPHPLPPNPLDPA